MKVTIDRNLCTHVLPECERCFARFVRNPQGEDRLCITKYVEDDDPILYLTHRFPWEPFRASELASIPGAILPILPGFRPESWCGSDGILASPDCLREIRVTLKYDHEEEEFALTPEERALIATDGWSQFVRVQPAFYRA